VYESQLISSVWYSFVAFLWSGHLCSFRFHFPKTNHTRRLL